MKIFLTIVATILTSIVLLLVYIFSGQFNVAATAEHGGILNWILYNARVQSVEVRSDNIETPPLDSRDMVLSGLSDYIETCAQCHGEPGQPPGILKQGLNPPPPDLQDIAVLNPEQQYWIINYGIRMTGMPAFGVTHEDGEIWPIVAFLQEAEDMGTNDYRQMKTQLERQGSAATNRPTVPENQ